MNRQRISDFSINGALNKADCDWRAEETYTKEEVHEMAVGNGWFLGVAMLDLLFDHPQHRALDLQLRMDWCHLFGVGTCLTSCEHCRETHGGVLVDRYEEYQRCHDGDYQLPDYRLYWNARRCQAYKALDMGHIPPESQIRTALQEFAQLHTCEEGCDQPPESDSDMDSELEIESDADTDNVSDFDSGEDSDGA